MNRVSVPLRGSWTFLLAVAGMACGHSDPFVTASNAQTDPFVAGTEVRLTYNAEQDYWPTWTEDSAGVLYAYVPVGRADHDRCVGLLRPTGGTRLWEMCDNQPGHGDSTDSFSAFALGRDGRLLYQEVTAQIGKEVPDSRALWLADSAHPFVRRKLMDFPILIDGIEFDWLGDLSWTGPDTFVALATEYVPQPGCFQCSFEDSAFVGKFVVTGQVDASGATLSVIHGTEGANAFGLAEQGNSVVFATGSGNLLHRVPRTGGTATLLGPVGAARGKDVITGIACRGSTCVVAVNQVTLFDAGRGLFADLSRPAGTLHAFNLATGTSRVLRVDPRATNAAMVGSPLIHPNGIDVVVQSGGTAGHLVTAFTLLSNQPPVFAPPGGDLYLYKGILP